MTHSENKISLLSVFVYSLMLALLFLAGFTISQRRPELPESLVVEEDTVVVNTDISNAYALQAIISHRDNLLATSNSPKPIFGNCSPGSLETHQFTYRDAWGKNAFSLTITSRGEAAIASWQAWINNDEKRRFELGLVKERMISQTAWSELKKRIRNSKFLESAPLALDENGFPVMGADGDTWTIESCVDGRYHFADRWSPYGPEYASFRDIGKAMVESAGSVYRLPEIGFFDYE